MFLGPPSRIGSRPRGKKSRAVVDTVYLECALTRFSGYIAIDELYDGPFCVLSLVDNRAFIRLSFRVLEHDPTQNDIRRFLADFKARLDVRGLTVRGVTTDGSELYPEPLKELWPDVPHQVCEFHVIKEITKAVLHALAATRKKLRDRIPKQPRGRPRKAERAQSRKATRQQQQVSKLFEHRYLFVQHRLTADQKTTLQRITRGLAHLRRLRQIMEEVYPLFDRRCRTETALARLAQLRGRVSRCKRLGRALDKLSSPNLEKALTFLDDKLLPATSNAVERSNRRYRKAQKSIYSVRTAEHIRQRIALDMQRDQQRPIAHRPRRPCIRPVLGRKNSKNDATVSQETPAAGVAPALAEGHPATTAGEQAVPTSIPVVQHRLTADSEDNLSGADQRAWQTRRLRQIMEEVYRLFDRRCRTETALARLAQLGDA